MSHIARSTLIVAVFFGLEKGLGFLRQIIIARQFGLSKELDAFNAANNLPDLLFALISGGALAMALIPVLAEYLEEQGHPQAWKLFSRIANLIFLVTAGVSILLAIFAEPLVSWRLGVAPGFEAVQQALVADLMRLNLIATVLFSLAGLAIAGLQANQHFLLPALAPSMYDIGALFGAIILAPQTGYQIGPITLPAFGLGVHGLVYGTILGALLFLGIQIPGLLRFKFRWSPSLGIGSPGVRRVLLLMGPRVFNVLFIQAVFLAQDNLASRLEAGAVTALVYGWLFMQVPESLIGTAIGTVLLPTLAEQNTRRNWEAYRRTLNQTIRVILALTLPSAFLLAFAIRPLVGLLDFSAAGTELVVWTTRAYLVGLVGHSLLEIGVRAFYARQNALTPLIAAGAAFAGFILLGAPLAFGLGAPGIALANSLVYTGEALVLLYLLHRLFPGILDVRSTLPRVAVGAVISGGLVYLLMGFPFHPLLLAAGALAAGGALALVFIWPEIRLLIKL
ncbi:MAG TPA: murein biosynthesis integral membrane protein MurJ [Anaerolineales bacterium]|nr:murein biosynthesis integral membrane protein MurJ [Anaerolineales bacterium]